MSRRRNRRIKKRTTYGLTSPVGGGRGCLCEDGTYDIRCCNGDLQAQGVGNLYKPATDYDERDYFVNDYYTR